jgi:hypothetical protein
MFVLLPFDWYSLKKGFLCQFPYFSSSLEFQYCGKVFNGSGGSSRSLSPRDIVDDDDDDIL